MLLNTQDVALLFDCSYDHVYKRIISHPEFPKAIRQVDGKIAALDRWRCHSLYSQFKSTLML